ncbi:hypothetical protein [Halalkalicoccus tibetensis]|uniref:Uncharacterized protein n=1 Tax=Halalkalicoccus tibetensis TaxID=175632 RepID=A0ABD5V383_9EURY
MSTNQADPKLKFPAGRFEDSLVTLIIALQGGIGIMTILVSFFYAHLVVNSYFIPQEKFSFYPGVLALALGMAAFIYLLHRLYE